MYKEKIPALFLGAAIAGLAIFLLQGIWAKDKGDAGDLISSRSDAVAIINDLYKIVTPNGIDIKEEVTIGGVQQWITVRGRDKDNPILLFIHGGPGVPEMPTSWTFQSPWEDYFTVVQWDQRGAGKTYNANDPEQVRPTLTFDQIVTDATELVQYLKQTYNKDKVFVMGHSWGSVVGLELARRSPELLYAYVGYGQVINRLDNERVGYEGVIRLAKAANHEEALRELASIAPYPEADGDTPLDKLNLQRKWSVHFGGLTYGRDSYNYYHNASWLSPDYTDEDLNAISKGSNLSLVPLFTEMGKVDFSAATEFDCPIIIFNGRHDLATPPDVAADWFETVNAPTKKLVWFEQSAHMIQIEEPGRMLVHLVLDVLPLAE